MRLTTSLTQNPTVAKAIAVNPNSQATSLLRRRAQLLLLLIALLMSGSVYAQYNTATVNGTIAAGEYGTHTDGQNQGTNTITWLMSWDASNLYIGISGASNNSNEGSVLYIDRNPIIPVNGGSNSNGSLVGQAYDRGNFNLPFRADIVIYFRSGYWEYRTADGSNGWNGATNSSGAISSGSTTLTYAQSTAGSGAIQEISIPWSVINGGGSIPSSFNWFGAKMYDGGASNNGIYGQLPAENPGGAQNVAAYTLNAVRYYTVSTTANTTATKPFSRNSYTHNDADVASFGTISVWDFTMNRTGRTITRNTGAGGAWTISGTLALGAGTITSGTSTTTISAGDINISGGTLTLSGSAGGDLNVSGNFTKTGGTFTCNGRAVNFNGSNKQTFSSNATENINFLLIGNTGADSVILASNVNIPAPSSSLTTISFTNGGKLKVNSGVTLTVNSSGAVLGNVNLGGANSRLHVFGTFNNTGTTTANTFTNFTAATFIVAANAIYSHNCPTGTIPTGSWAASSTLQINSSLAAGTLSQSFGNVNYNVNATYNINNATNLVQSGSTFSVLNGTIRFAFDITSTQSATWSGNLTLNGGNFTVHNKTVNTNDPDATLTVNNLTLTNGTLIILNSGASVTSNTPNGTLIVNGNALINGGTLDLLSASSNNTSSITSNLSLLGNLTWSSGTIQRASATANPTATINFNAGAGSSQTFTQTLGSVTYTPTGSITWSETGASNLNITALGTTGTIRGNTSISGDLTINCSSTATLEAATTVSGVVFMTQGALSGTFTSIGSLNYNGTAAQTTGNTEWPATLAKNVTISNNSAAGVTLNADKTNYNTGGTFTVNNGSRFNFSTFSIAGTGAITVQSGATIASAFTTNQEGFGSSSNITTGSIRVTAVNRSLSTGANYILNGAAAQSTGTNMPATVNNLTIDNTGGVTLSRSTTVNGTLTFTNGLLTTSGNTLTLANAPSNANESRYIVADATGTVTFNGVSTQRTLPIGTATLYAPLAVTAGSATNYTAYVTASLPCVPTTAANMVNLAWGLSGSNTPTQVVFQWPAGAHAASFAPGTSCDLGRFNTSCPYSITNLGIPSGSGPYTLTATSGLGSTSNQYVIGNLNSVFIAAPTIATTVAASNITQNSASSGGQTITGLEINPKGVVWNTSATPTVALSTKTNDGLGTGNFTSSLSFLSAQTRYFVRAYATNANTTAYGNEIEFRTLSNPATAQASNFTATAASSSTINLSWTGATFPSSGATQAGYAIIYSTGTPTLSSTNGTAPAAGTGTLVTITPTNLPTTPSVSTSIGSLAASTAYNFLIVPFTWDGTNASTYHYLTASAPTATATTQANAVAPSVTTDAATLVTSAGARLNGNVTSDGGATISPRGFVYSTTDATPTIGEAGVINQTVSGTTGTFLFDATLLANTTYYYQAYAVNSVNTTYGGVQSFTTLKPEPTAQATSLVFSTITTSGFNVAFTAANGSPDGYIVIRSTSASLSANPADGTTYTAGNALGGGTIISVGTTTSGISSSSLAAGTTYYIYVFAYNNSGTNINYLTTSPLTGNTITLTSAPANVSIGSISTTGFTVSWDATTGAASYRLDVSTASDFSSFVSGFNDLTVSGTSQAVSSLTANTLYYVRVRAVNASGPSANSSANAPTLSNAPTVGTGSGATSDAITANWTAPSGGAATFTYEAAISTSSTFATTLSTQSNISSSSTSFQFTGLSANTTYYFRVRAVNASGNSAWSSISTAIATTSATYYSKSTGFLNDVNTWGTNTDGSGSSPANFAAAGATYNIRNRTSATINGDWTVSGTGSKIIVGVADGSSSCNFSVGSSFTVTSPATEVNPSSTITRTTTGDNSWGTLSFASGAKYVHNASGGTLPTATWNANSTLQIDANLAANQFVQSFGNVEINNAATFTMLSTSGSTITINGSFTYNSSAAVNISTRATSVTLNVAGDFNVYGSGTLTGNLTTSSATTINISGKYTQSSGTFNYANTLANQTMTIAGNLELSGGTFRIGKSQGVGSSRTQRVIVNGDFLMTSGSGVFDFSDEGDGNIFSNSVLALLDVKGNFTHSAGTISETASDADVVSRITLIGTTGTQTIESTGQTGIIDFNIAGSNAQTVVAATKTFVLSSASTMTIANGTSSPDLSISGTFRNASTTPITASTSTWAVNNGGNYIHNTTAAVSGLLDRATLNTGSTFTYRGSSTLTPASSFASRTYRNLVFESTSGTMTAINSANSTSLIIAENLTVGSGTTFGFNNTGTPGNAIRGNITVDGTLNFAPASVGTVNLDGSTTQTISGSGTISTGANATLAVGASSTIDFGNAATIGGTGLFTTASGSTLITGNTAGINGSLSLTNRSLNAGTNYTFNNSVPAVQVTGDILTAANNLTLNNSAGLSLSADLSVTGTLTLNSGRLTLGARNLTMGNAATFGGTLSASNMVVADAAGQLRKTFTGNGNFTFPVGDVTSTAEYSPVNVAVTGSGYSSAFVGVNLVDDKHPNNANTTNFLTRYWNVTQSGITNCSATITGTYLPADISGTEGSIQAAQLVGTFNQATNGWVKTGGSDLGANTLTFTGATLSGITAFTGITKANPTVTISGGGVTVCTGTSVTLTANPVGDGTFTYSWDNGLGTGLTATPGTSSAGTTNYTVTVRDGNGITSAASTAVSVEVVAQPSFATQPTSASICVGGSFNPTVAASGGTPSLTYRWQYSANGTSGWNDVVNGTPANSTYTNTTSATLFTVSGSIAAGSYFYRAVASATGTGCNSVNSDAATLTVVAQPSITTQPVSATVCVGGTFNPTVAASGGTPSLTYRWQYSANGTTGWNDVVNGTPANSTYTNTTSATLFTVSGNIAAGSYFYRAVISATGSGCTTVNSDAATLTVVAQPSITTQPVSASVCVGGTFNPTVAASGGTPSLTYRWQYSANGTSGWNDVVNGTPANSTYTNTTSATLFTVSGNIAAGSYYYRAVASATGTGCNSVNSDAATLTVVAQPSITTQPVSATVCVGGTFNPTVAASGGTPSLTYRWQYSANGTTGWNDVVNGTPANSTYTNTTSATLFTVSGSIAAGSYFYRAVASATGTGCNSVNSDAATLTVVGPISISAQPTGATVCVGGSFNPTVAASGGTPSLTYRWQYSANGTTGWNDVVNGTPANSSYTNTTSATLFTVSGNIAAGSYFYRAVISATGSGCTTVNSDAATLTVVAQPSITTQPVSASVCVGGTFNPTVVASGGTPSLTYRWQYSANGTTGWNDVVNGTPANSTYTNTTSATLFTVSGNIAAGSYFYRAVASATGTGCNSVNSDAATLTIDEQPVAGTASASATNICNNGTSLLSLSGSSGNIQWRQSTDNSTWSNVSGGSGATSSSYTTAALSNGLYYQAQVSRGVCTAVTSNSVLVTVNESNAGASNYSSAWSNNQNDLANGFGAWSLSSSGNAGFFAGTGSNINTTRAWGIFANSGGTAAATRPLTSDLSDGGTISFAMDNGFINNGSEVGFRIRNSSGTNLLTFSFTGGQNKYQYTDNGGTANSTVDYTSSGLRFAFTYTASGRTYALTIMNSSGTNVGFISGTLAGSGAPGQVVFFNNNAGSGGDFDAYFNSLVLSNPAIRTQPTSPAAVCAGNGVATFTVAANGSNLSHQWQVSTDAGANWNNVSNGGVYSGVTDATLTITNPTADMNNYRYRAVITGGLSGCTATVRTDGAATLTIATLNTWEGDVSSNWNTAGNWSCNSVPVSTTNVIIPQVTSPNVAPVLNTGDDASINSITIQSGGSFTMGGTKTLTIAAGGSFTNNGTFTRGDGTVNFAGAATLSGTSTTAFNNITTNTGQLTTTTVPRIHGTLRINGGNLSAAPIYEAGSTLFYNTTYGRFVEWSRNSTTGTLGTDAGYPNNVTINAGTLDVFNNGTGEQRGMAGTLTINSGATLSFGAMNANFRAGNGITINSGGTLSGSTMSGTVAIVGNLGVSGTFNGGSMSGLVTVSGDLTVGGTLNMSTMSNKIEVSGNVTNNGTLTLSSANGGDIKVGGNWTRGSGATFTPSTRAVFFTGSGNNVINSSGGASFDYLVSEKTGGSIQLGSNMTVNAPNTGNALSLLSAATFDLNGNTLNLTNAAASSILASNGSVQITGTGTVNISGGLKTVASSNNGTLSFGNNVTVTLEGGFNPGSSLTTINGTLRINANGFVSTNSPIYGANSLLRYHIGTTSPVSTVLYGRSREWNASSGSVGTTPGYPFNVQISSNTTLDYPNTGNNGADAFSTALFIGGNLTIDAGSSLYMDYGGNNNKSGSLTVAGDVNNAGNLSLGNANGGNMTVGGNWTRTGIAGGFTPNSRTVIFNGSGDQTITRTGGSGTSTFDGLTVSKSGGNLILANNVTCNGAVTLTTGDIVTNSNTLIISSTGDITAGTDGSHVVGNLQRHFATGSNVSRLYAIGDGTNYAPATVTLGTVNTAGTVDLRNDDGAHPNIGTYGLSATKYISRYWSASNVSAVFTNGSIAFTYKPGDLEGGASSNNIRGARYTGSAWAYPETAVATNQYTVSGLNNTTLGIGHTGGECAAFPSFTVNPSNNGPLCVGSTLNLTSGTITGGSGSYTYAWSGPNSFASTSQNPSRTNVVAGDAGSYTLTVTDAFGCSNSGSIASTSVSISQTPTTANAGNNQTLCISAISTSLSANAPASGTGAWSVKAGSPSTSLSQFNDPSSRTATFTPAGGAGTYVLIWTISNAPCTASTSEVTIKFDAVPDNVSAGADQTLCNTSTFTLAGNSPTPATATGLWSVISGPGTLNNASVNNTTITGVTAGSQTTLQWTVTNGVCTAVSDQVVLTNKALPTTAAAGSDQEKCNNGSFTLAGNTATSGIGAWTVQSGTATITDASSPTSTVTGVPVGTSATLRWTISNSPCTASFDDVILTNSTPPATSIAGDNQTQCNNSTFTLAGNTPSPGNGLWTIVTGSATITAPTSPTSTVTGVTAGTSVTLRWTVTNGSCSSASDVTLTNNNPPSTAAAGNDQTSCSNAAVTLAANAATGTSTGTWSILAGSPSTSTLQFSDVNSNTATFTPAGGNGVYTLRWTISAPGCSNTTDDVEITVTEGPIQAIAGNNQSKCDNGNFTMAANTPNSGATGTWTVISGSATIANGSENSPTATVTLASGTTATLRWTISKAPCTSTTSDVILTYTAANTWTGSTSTAWNEGSNWSCGTVPNDGNSITIPAGLGTYPTISTEVNIKDVTINTNATLNMSSGGKITFANGGTFTNNGTFNNGSGTVEFAGTGTVAGSSGVVFHNVNIAGGVNFGNAVSTVNGTLQINSGGFVNTNAPRYGSSSNLLYNTTGTYNRSIEWSANGVGTIGTTAGYPNNVTIANNTTLALGPNSGANIERALHGNLTIESGSTLSMTSGINMLQPLTVRGNAVINGTLTLSGNTGGDLNLGGNMTIGASGTFSPNNRSVKFNSASANQTITKNGGGTIDFSYLNIDNTASGGKVVLASGTNLRIISTNSNDALRVLQLTNGDLDLGVSKLTLSGSAPSTTNIQVANGVRNILGSAGSSIEFIGSATSGSQNLNVFPVNSTTDKLNITANATLETSVGVRLTNTILNGSFQINVNGFVAGSVTADAPVYNEGSTLIYNNGAAGFNRNYEWIASSGTLGTTPGYPDNVIVKNSTVLSLGNASVSSGVAERAIAGDMTIEAGSDVRLNAMAVPLTINGNLSLAGTLTLSSEAGGNLNLAGNWSRTGAGALTQNGRNVRFFGSALQTVSRTGGETMSHVVVDKTGQRVQLIDNLTISSNLAIDNGTLDVNTTVLNVQDVVSKASTGTLMSAVTGSVLYSKPTNSQSVLAADYGNLTFSNFAKTLPSTGTIRVANEFTPGSGTGHTIAGSTIEFNGSGAQSVPEFNYNNLTISGARGNSALTLGSGTIGVAGNFTASATGVSSYVTTGNTVDFNGTTSQTISAFDFNSVRITGDKNNGTITLGSGTIRLSGNYTVSANNIGSFVTSGNTFEFISATAPQSISAMGPVSFNNLVINKPDQTLNAISTSTINMAGTITLAAGQFIPGPTAMINMTGGNWTNNGGTFTRGNSTVVFSGAGDQEIGGSTTNPQEFANVTMNKASGILSIAENKPVKIDKVLTLSQGTFAPGTGTTIEFDNNLGGNQDVPRANYHHLKLSRGGTKVLANEVAVAGDLIVENPTSGTTTVTPGAIIKLNGNNNQAIAGLPFRSVQISGGATKRFTSNASILGAMTFESGSGAVDLDGTSNDLLFTVRSIADSTARIANVNGWSLSGKAVVERYVPSQRKWRLISVPTVPGETLRQALTRQIDGSYPNPVCFTADAQAGSGTLITGHSMSSCTNATSVGFDHLVSGGASSIRYYNATASNPWASSTSTPTILSAPTQSGYLVFIRGDRQATGSGSNVTTLRPKGDLIQGNYNIPVNARFGVLGNPYASPISFESLYEYGVAGGNNSKIRRTFWVWDANLTNSSNGVGGYRTISPDNENSSNPTYSVTPSSSLPVSNYLMINSGQAIMVERRGSENVNVTVKESHKVANSGNLLNLRTTNTPVGKIKVDMYRANGSTLEMPMDGVIARFADWYDAEPTDIYDVYKNNQFEENLSISRRDNTGVLRYLGIESRPMPTVNDTIFMPFYFTTNRDYALRFNAENMASSGLIAYLQDQFTGRDTIVPLNGSQIVYPFTVTADANSKALSRFRMVFRQGAALPVNFISIKAKATGATNTVQWTTAQEESLKVFEIERSLDGNSYVKVGEQKPQNNAGGAAYDWIDQTPASGANYYRIRAVDEDGSVDYSMAVKVNRGIDVKEIKVNTNIASDGSVSVQLNAQPAGVLTLNLTSVSGQLVGTKQLVHNGGSSNQMLQLTQQQLSDGVYFLSVQTAEGLKETFKLVK